MKVSFKVIVILFQDVRIEGVQAVVRIPKGQTAEETYAVWLHREQARDVKESGEATSLDSLRESFPYEEMEITTLR